jgi:hypothetical protein
VSVELPPVLQDTLRRAGYASLTELARAADYAPQTLHAVRSGVRRCSPRMARALGVLLGLPPLRVAAVLCAPRGEVAHG